MNSNNIIFIAFDLFYYISVARYVFNQFILENVLYNLETTEHSTNEKALYTKFL